MHFQQLGGVCIHVFLPLRRLADNMMSILYKQSYRQLSDLHEKRFSRCHLVNPWYN
nr:MAG TPA: hypothetical protein [Caudoviricetes sp.]